MERRRIEGLEVKSVSEGDPISAAASPRLAASREAEDGIVREAAAATAAKSDEGAVNPLR